MHCKNKNVKITVQRGCRCRHSLSVFTIACRLINVITVKIGGALNTHGSRSHFLLYTSFTPPPHCFPFRSPQQRLVSVSRQFLCSVLIRTDRHALIYRHLFWNSRPNRGLERTRIADCSRAGKYCWIERESRCATRFPRD